MKTKSLNLTLTVPIECNNYVPAGDTMMTDLLSKAQLGHTSW